MEYEALYESGVNYVYDENHNDMEICDIKF